jgi:deazaflavin-dependent oxidoreductase (nitroreductase family)
LTDSDLGAQLAAWGKVARIATRRRNSGDALTVAVGYFEEPDGSLLVAAGASDAAWARNLEAEPACIVEIADTSWPGVAESLEGQDAARAVRELILKYGTPAERLGSGPSFRIRRAVASATPKGRDAPD